SAPAPTACATPWGHGALLGNRRMRAGSSQVPIGFSIVMPGPVPGIHVFAIDEKEDVGGRDKPGQDGFFLSMITPTPFVQQWSPFPVLPSGGTGRNRYCAAQDQADVAASPRR